MAAMGPGRAMISSRLLRNFNFIYLMEFEERTLYRENFKFYDNYHNVFYDS